MSSSKERRSDNDRRQAPIIKYFPILDFRGRYIESDRRTGDERRDGSSTTLQFISANEFLASLSEIEN